MNQTPKESAGGWKIDRVTSAEMAERMDCTPQSVNKAARKAGITQGHDGKYDAAKLQAAMEQGRAMDKRNGYWSPEENAGLLEWKTRHEEQKTRQLERKNDIEEGKLVWVADVEAAQARVHQAVVADIINACESIAPRLEGLTVRAIAAKLKEAMTDALRHIANKEPGETERQSDGGYNA